MKCDICGTPLSGVFVGNGDGTGQRFAHEACYWKDMYDKKCLEHKKDQQEHLNFIQSINVGLTEMERHQSINRLHRKQIDVQITNLADAIDRMGK